MIKYSDAELISVLPPHMKDDPDIIAISYAYKKAMEKLLLFSQYSMLYANIDNLPDEILDMLALDMRSQYYDEGLDSSVKKDIIKNSLAWYAKGGTVSAVQEMVRVVFGGGDVIEWPNYPEGAGQPGTFDIITDRIINGEQEKELAQSIANVKRATSHLRHVRVRKSQIAKLFAGGVRTERITICAKPEALNTLIRKHNNVKLGVGTLLHVMAVYQPERSKK